MRPIRSGTSSSCRPAFPATTMSTGLGRFFGGVHSACAAWGTLLSDLRPGGPPSRGMLVGTLGLVLAVVCQDSRLDWSLAIRACCVASSAGCLGEGRGDFFVDEWVCLNAVMFISRSEPGILQNTALSNRFNSSSSEIIVSSNGSQRDERDDAQLKRPSPSRTAQCAWS